jgi:hypothetical protein
VTPLASGTEWRTYADELTGQIQAQVTSADFYFSFLSHSGQLDSVKRMVGCALLCQLPEAGLDDAIETIHGQLSFYLEDIGLQSPEETVTLSEGYALGVGHTEDDPALW